MPIESIQSLSSMKIDMDKIYRLQEQFGPLLAQIDSLKPNYSMPEKADRLYLAIHKRMQKYSVRLADEFKLRRDKDKVAMYTNVLNDIANYAYSLLAKPDRITQEDINILHTKLYPKGLWGTTIGPGGEKFFKKYPAGEFRQERDFRRNKDGREYDYADFKNIPELVDIINDFLYDESYTLYFPIRAILYILYIAGTHPYYNGNGTVYIILLSVLLLKNGYDIPENLQEYFKACVNSQDIIPNARHDLDYEPLIRGFLELFIGEKETKKDT